MSVHVCVCVFMCACVHMCVYVEGAVYVCMHVHVCGGAVYVCVCACMCVHVCAICKCKYAHSLAAMQKICTHKPHSIKTLIPAHTEVCHEYEYTSQSSAYTSEA